MTMPSAALALPMVGMMCLTLLVWVYTFVQRIGYMSAQKMDAEQLKTPADVARLIPDEVAASGNNLKNLFELPVIFYAVCLYLTTMLQVDQLYVYCAWGFLLFRIAHSLIHCSNNKVAHRFAAYILSSIALWIMVVRALIDAL